MSLQRRIIIVLIGLTLLVSLPTLLLAGYALQHQAVDQRTEEGVLVAETVSQITTYVQTLREQTDILAGVPVFDPPAALSFVLNQLAQIERIESIWILDPNLAVVASTNLLVMGDDNTLNETDFAQLQNTIIAGETVTRVKGDTLRVYSPTRGQDGVINGAVLIYMSLYTRGTIGGIPIVLLVFFLGLLAAAWIISLLFARWITRPLARLNEAASAIAQGKFDLELPTERRDEYGQVARGFGAMARQLSESIERLEERVNTRTRDLQIAGEALLATNAQLQIAYDIAQLVHATDDVNQLMTEVAILLEQRYEFYAVMIFCITDERLNLRTAVTQDQRTITPDMFGNIELDAKSSAIALAVRLKEIVKVEDVKTSSMKPRRDLFPEAASEFALPLIAAGNVYGVLNILTGERVTFTDEEIRLLEAVAKQLAVALRSGNLAMQITKLQEQAQAMRHTETQEFVSLSGELRQPMYQLVSASELLLSGVYGAVTRSQVEALQNIVAYTEDLLLRVNDTLGISRIEVDNLRLFVEAVEINRVLRDVQEQVNVLMKDRAVVFASDISGDLPSVWADERRLRQALLALFGWLARESQRVVFDATRITDGVQVSIASDVVGVSHHSPVTDAQRLIEAQGGSFRLQPRTNDSLAIRFTLLASSIHQTDEDSAQ